MVANVDEVGDGVAPPRRQAFVRLRSQTTGEWFVEPLLRARLAADADQHGSNMNEVAIRILARLYQVALPESDGFGRHVGRGDGADKLVLRLPPELAQVIEVSGSTRSPRRGLADEIRAALSAHYGFRVPPRTRRKGGRRRPEAPAAA